MWHEIIEAGSYAASGTDHLTLVPLFPDSRDLEGIPRNTYEDFVQTHVQPIFSDYPIVVEKYESAEHRPGGAPVETLHIYSGAIAETVDFVVAIVDGAGHIEYYTHVNPDTIDALRIATNNPKG